MMIFKNEKKISNFIYIKFSYGLKKCNKKININSNINNNTITLLITNKYIHIYV